MKKLGLLLLPLAWSAAHAQGVAPVNYDTDMFLGSPIVTFNLNDIGPTFREGATGLTFAAGGAGVTTFRQPGFNRLATANYSALFAYNSKAVAPNNTIGDFEWNQPMTWTAHIRNLNITRSNFTRSEIASKGPKGSNLQPSDLTSKGWDFLLHWTGSQTRLCVLLSGSLVAGVSTGFTVCANMDLVNGVEYDVMARWDGSGVNGGFTFMVNNLPVASIVEQGGASFGTVSTAIGGSGTGYANSTPFTSTGGGSACVVAGTMTSASGVPASISYTSNAGCSSVPTLVLTAPTGTGVTLTVSLTGTSMSTLTSPLTIAGNVSDSIAGQGTNVHNAAGIQIDEFAMYPSAPGIASPLPYQLFADTVGWQQFIALTSTPVLMIHDNDGCGDSDNYWAIDTAIRLHQRGQIRLLALNNTITVNTDSQTYRSLLDRGGLGHVPMSVSTVPFTPTSGNCNNIATFTGTVRAQSSYPTDVVTYRSALSSSPDNSVIISLGGAYSSINALLQSPADGIDARNGTDLFKAKVKGFYIQVGYVGTTITGDNNINENFAAAQNVYNILATAGVPYYLTGGGAGPFSVPVTGPTRYSLNPSDPAGLWLNTLFTSTGGATQRSGWDLMTVLAPLLPGMFTNLQGNFVLTGTSSSWTGVFTAGSGTGFYQTINSLANSNALGVIANSLTGSQPLPRSMRGAN